MPTRKHAAVDRSMILLLRLVREDTWEPKSAARALHGSVTDPRVLSHLRARVHRALFERPSQIGERATQTLEMLKLPSQGE